MHYFFIKNKINILFVAYEALLFFFFLYEEHREFWLILLSVIWFPIILIEEYSKLTYKLKGNDLAYMIPTTSSQLSENIWVLSFYIPIIGPMIAIKRINELKNLIEKNEKIKKDQIEQ